MDEARAKSVNRRRLLKGGVVITFMGDRFGWAPLSETITAKTASAKSAKAE